ncbi:hypothetical protein [Lactiplantibacillus plantarum]|uniref:hypothetical protein n=1 Tax=Lactiplantibacillus plantarum TaxID=1590 RepID=UPI001BAB62B8|nr:hypothetical protein [Lactiplantibacillus plantarum]MBS0937609.1 hypothetical protein [Lactiplantibacillus plantarum]MBS0945341.1 hypothetical protein [Lactiplantibacillus plantarum]
MATNNLFKSGKAVLNNARKLGQRIPRDKLKHQQRAYRAISSPQSLKTYQSTWKEVSTWLFNHENVNYLRRIKPEMIERFLLDKVHNGGIKSQGASIKTLKGYVSVINKVQVCANNLTMNERYSLRQFKHLDLTNKKHHTVYKSLTGAEWIDRNPDTYLKNQQAIDTIRAFGLRARELATLNSKSFIQDTQTGKYYVQTIGKGGKYRLAECRKDLQTQMQIYYNTLFKANSFDLTNFKGSKDYLLRNMKKGLKIEFKGQKRHDIPRHIFRADYAENLLKQKFQEYPKGPVHCGYRMVKVHEEQVDLQKHLQPKKCHQSFQTIKTIPLGQVQIQIGAYKGPLRAFTEVSKNSGHNRLDVLLKYL